MSSLVAISPFADLIAFAKTRYLAVYKLKTTTDTKAIEGDNTSADGNSREFQLSFDTQLSSGLNSTDQITSIVLVPIVSQQKNSFAFHDWTALMVGFSSGNFRVYTENGGLLLTQLLHNEPIVDIKCQTFRSNSTSSDSDQILVVYKTTVVLIDGLSLYQTLRFYRNQLAKSQSTLTGFQFASQNDSTLSFTYKKWKLEDSEDIQDCHNIGFGPRNRFDHLVSQSIDNGPYGPLRSKVPSANLLITCGANPYVGFYRAREVRPIRRFSYNLFKFILNSVKNRERLQYSMS